MSTELNLEEIEARCEKATPGPWGFASYSRHGAVIGPTGDVLAESVFPPSYETIEVMRRLDFIAHARTDVPALCREVRRLREELRGQFSTMCDLAKMSNEADDKIRSLRDWQTRARLVCLDVVNNWCDERAKSDARALLSELEGEK